MAHTHAKKPLDGARVAITRPAGTGAAIARQVRALGGAAFSLPGSSLRSVDDAVATRVSLDRALRADFVIFSSPAAVRFASGLRPLRTRSILLAPGHGTAGALKRAGVGNAIAPARADSEGLLALPILQQLRGKAVGILGARGGRGLLQRELAARGADVAFAEVYRRMPARLDRRHARALTRGRAPLYVPLSSGEALANLMAGLPDAARRALLAGTAIASSARLQRAARLAGFARVLCAGSAHDADLIETIIAAHAARY
ncbi:MAG: uroporphyrinogen-III synthase [Rhodanobacteraceae bacterium]